jgi:hypothetical protein
MVSSIVEKCITSIFRVGDDAFFQNIGNHLKDYTAKQLWKPQMTSFLLP